jgi:single-stranded-DNA-specific exonuclease
VASRLVERYGVPVFIATYEDDTQTQIRGSARSIPEFDVFEALHFCGDLMNRFGGHRAAGGFTLAVENLEKLRSRLSEFAHQHLKPEHLKPLVNIDVQAQFTDITQELYQQMDRLQPCGIGNPEPVFWSANVKVLDQRIVGQSHLKVTLSQDIQSQEGGGTVFTAIAWRWAEYFPLPQRIDVAYRLRENTWNGKTALELELIGVRPAGASTTESSKAKITATKPVAPEKAVVGRSPLLPAVELQIKCPEPPKIDPSAINWHPLKTLEAVMPQIAGNVLLYGYQRPYISAQSLAGELTYDRPRGQCATVLLWTLPPSWTHLRWLLALAKPEAVYVRNGLPKMPDKGTLRSQLSFEIVKNPDAPLNLLDLGQQWWVAPSTLVAALREMEYPCSSFGVTASLEQEIQRLGRWYNCPAQRLATLS